MTKVMYLLFFILQSPTGADQLESIVHQNAKDCEQQRQWFKARSVLVASHCQRVEISYE